ncbi:MAG TPA: class I SAM-dependent methyltransferase [Geobacteraceae bacterium]
MTTQSLYGAVPLSHLFLRQRVRSGDRAVDATCGNGKDTLLLAELVGSGGRVWAFDIQEKALARTEQLVDQAGFAGWVTLVSAGHERLADVVDEQVRAIIFNLGYLPGGDQSVMTGPASTRDALEQAQALLMAGGIIVVVVYTGHPGGDQEWEAVRTWAAALPPGRFNVWQATQVNRSATAPFLLLVEKQPGQVTA